MTSSFSKANEITYDTSTVPVIEQRNIVKKPELVQPGKSTKKQQKNRNPERNGEETKRKKIHLPSSTSTAENPLPAVAAATAPPPSLAISASVIRRCNFPKAPLQSHKTNGSAAGLSRFLPCNSRNGSGRDVAPAISPN
ncbi:hypothetical protein GWI33_021134 [Rhynchophorus ferrugineus]|uniref:Uncharacterized protein n=1 Tax=Rhynchophorus ferrugineus TaxID=354439 RepID=A0A834HVC1_RHYFE|nr:hypothetical protein GWI33_021134 [Rhynchophorus ferrugineus]